MTFPFAFDMLPESLLRVVWNLDEGKLEIEVAAQLVKGGCSIANLENDCWRTA
jgi:hypothetical protein